MSREAHHNNKAHYKHCVGDDPVKQLCEKENVPYGKVMERYYYYKSTRKNTSLSESQLFKNIIQEVKEKMEYERRHYTLSDGRTVYELCKENGASVSIVTKYIDDNYATTTLSSDELIHEAIKYASIYIYYLKGECVEDICEREGIEDVARVKKNIAENIRKHPKNDKDSIIENCITRAKIEMEAKYFIDDKPLKVLCKPYAITPTQVIIEYNKRMKAKAKAEGIEWNTSIVDGKVLKESYEYVISRVTRGTEDVIDNLPLAYYCNEHGYPTETIRKYKNALRIKDKISSDEDLIRTAIDMYEELKDKDLRPLIFNNLKECNDPAQLAYNCCLLNVDVKKVLELHSLTFNYYQAFSLVWFFGDKTNKNNEYTLSSENEAMILEIVKRLQYKTAKPVALPFIGLFRIYKSDLIDYDALQKEKAEKEEAAKKKHEELDFLVLKREELIPVELKIIYMTVNVICAKLGINANYEQLTEYRNAVRGFLIEAMDKCFERDENIARVYINKYIQKAFINYLKLKPGVLTKKITPKEEKK